MPPLFFLTLNLYTTLKKEELFHDDFSKQFKTGEELNVFLKELQKRVIEKMLEGELDLQQKSGQLDKDHATAFWESVN